MGVPRVRVVASWDGWCGACGAERPLVLTRTGRRGPKSWWAGVGVDDLPLTLTCRLCGVGVDVPPHEEDDPEVVVPADAPPAAAPDLATPGHQAVADALAALLRARTATAVPDARAPGQDDALDLLAAGVPALVHDRT